jgi:hypothetical protein
MQIFAIVIINIGYVILGIVNILNFSLSSSYLPESQFLLN